MTTSYDKPFRTVEEQIALLESRGLQVADRDEAAAWLRRVGYYRLSGYWYPFRRSEVVDGHRRMLDEFRAGTSFEQVVAVYEFDRRLRLLVLDGVERIEVALRFQVGHVLGRRGPFAHADPAALDETFAGPGAPPPALHHWMRSPHAAWMALRRAEQERSRADFVTHFSRKYGQPLPVWVATELIDLGGLSRLYSGMRQQDRDEIAADLRLRDRSGAGHGGALKDWLRHLTYVRNVCAHHARFWNVNVTERLSPRGLRDLPELAHVAEHPRAFSRPYASLAVLGLLTSRVHPGDDWRGRLEALVAEGLPTGRSAKEMGFPDSWRAHSLWSGAHEVGRVT